MIILDCVDNQLKKVTILDMLDEQYFKRGNKEGIEPPARFALWKFLKLYLVA